MSLSLGLLSLPLAAQSLLQVSAALSQQAGLALIESGAIGNASTWVVRSVSSKDSDQAVSIELEQLSSGEKVSISAASRLGARLVVAAGDRLMAQHGAAGVSLYLAGKLVLYLPSEQALADLNYHSAEGSAE